MLLRAASFTLALQVQEAADSMMASDVRDGLQNAIDAAHSGMANHAGHAHSYVDHQGDENSGDVIYTCDPDGDGDTDYMMCPYSIGTDSSDDDYGLDLDNAQQVAMRHSWEPVGDEADHYAGMQESKLYTKGPLPVCERFVSKKERDAASSSDFAGKGKSFPILKAADVKAAASSLGRAGSGNYSTDVIRKNIIRIAKAKGWTSSLPKSWQDGGSDSAKESAVTSGEESGIRLVESCAFPLDITIREAFTPGKLIKLIAPGPGSTAYYTREVLQKAARDKIFHAGLPMRIDHPTAAEEAARPEGSVKDWGAVLESDAVYRDDLPSGEGLYAPIKKFSDHAQIIDEKGPYAGVSIRANGNALTEAGGKRVIREGVPVLKEFTSAEGADMVTRAGAGGMFLSEAARPGISQQEAAGMTAEEVAKLVESALRKDRLPENVRAEATRLLESVSLRPETKLDVIAGVLRGNIPIKADGSLDTEALAPLVVAEAQRIGRIVAREGGTGVRGMGIAAPIVAPKPEEIAATEAAKARELAEDIRIYESLGMTKRGAELAARGREAA